MRKLATPSRTLTSGWAGRPYWMAHHMALGETIGSAIKTTQYNTFTLYAANGYAGSVSTALMGDPTLRMHVVAPASDLTVTTNGLVGADLSWNPSPDEVLGYAVYGASSEHGPFSRLNPELVEGTEFTVADLESMACYMVRAVKLEVSASGSYYNASQGIFQDLAGSFGSPSLSIAPSAAADQFLLSWPVNTTIYDLESTLAPASQVWSPVTNAVTLSNGVASVLLDSEGNHAFFRLQER